MLFHEYLLKDFKDDQIILKHKNIEYSYKDVLTRSNSFLKSFKQAGISKGERVILLMENGLDAICLQICCSMTGAIFIPVSPFEPVVRIEKIIHQYRPVVILVEDDVLKESFAGHFSAFCPLDKIIKEHTDEKPVAADNEITENDLIYIISTSGTTGNPKGIKMSHRAVVCFFEASVAHCGLERGDNVGTISPLQFDLSLLDLGAAWGSNACLSVFSQSFAYAPKKLLEALIRNKVTQFDSVPAIWNMMIRFCFDDIEKLTSLKCILYAGDKFTVRNIVLLREKLPDLRIINCFGQSESIACTFFDIGKVEEGLLTEISVGKGYKGSIFYLVDAGGEIIKENNIAGELWLSNGSLFEGYWENEPLTSQRLVRDKFDPLSQNMVYKTGDSLSRNEEGNYFFHGRMDNQIKVNGNRVELDEIEQAVLRYSNVTDAAAVARQEKDTSIVVLFVSVSPDNIVEEEGLRKYCRETLPLYMVPAQIIILYSPFPLSSNGKTDKKKLIEHGF